MKLKYIKESDSLFVIFSKKKYIVYKTELYPIQNKVQR
jgi:hypothetical protein